MTTETRPVEASKSTTAKKLRGRPFEVGHPGMGGRPRKGNSWADVLKSLPVGDKRALREAARDYALNGDARWAEWLVKHSGESGANEGKGGEVNVNVAVGVSLTWADGREVD